MSRQVDVKALVSHIVKGDGADKCRICLGDTSEGQVYLGDTVMKDGDTAVTLAELLQTITGVQVALEDELPSRLCSTCSHSAINAATFRSLCIASAEHWETTVQLLDAMPEPSQLNGQQSLYAVLSENILTYGCIGDDDESECGDLGSDVQNESPKLLKAKRQRKIKGIECQCPDCGKKFKRPQLLCKHLMDSKDFKRCCHICAAIMSRDKLIIHMREIHKTKLLNCKKCHALFQFESQMQRHMEKVHLPGAYSCGECGHNFESSSAFHGHMSAHSTKNCPKCDKLFLNHPCYLYHVPICCKFNKRKGGHRTKNKVLYEIRNKDNRKIKVGARGSADSECICDYCGKMFAGKRFVCAHIQIVHMKNTHRPCPYCGKSFAAAHMTVHMKKHKETTKFKCDQCDLVLKSKLGYVQHLRLHTGEKPYKCAHCSEKFSSSSRRSEHVHKVHLAGPVKKHMCNLCPAKYRLPFQLKKHISEAHVPNDSGHTIEFECPECHIKFGSCRSLLHHSKKHQKFSLKSINKMPVQNEQ